MSEYLDRKQVIDLYEKYHPRLATFVWEFGQELRQLPIVEERPHGEWKEYPNVTDENNNPVWYTCSCCNYCATWGDHRNYRFCPNCGADMRKEGDSDA